MPRPATTPVRVRLVVLCPGYFRNTPVGVREVEPSFRNIKGKDAAVKVWQLLTSRLAKLLLHGEPHRNQRTRAHVQQPRGSSEVLKLSHHHQRRRAVISPVSIALLQYPLLVLDHLHFGWRRAELHLKSSVERTLQGPPCVNGPSPDQLSASGDGDYPLNPLQGRHPRGRLGFPWGPELLSRHAASMSVVSDTAEDPRSYRSIKDERSIPTSSLSNPRVRMHVPLRAERLSPTSSYGSSGRRSTCRPGSCFGCSLQGIDFRPGRPSIRDRVPGRCRHNRGATVREIRPVPPPRSSSVSS